MSHDGINIKRSKRRHLNYTLKSVAFTRYLFIRTSGPLRRAWSRISTVKRYLEAAGRVIQGFHCGVNTGALERFPPLLEQEKKIKQYTKLLALSLTHTNTRLTSCTVSMGGGGSLFRHRLTMTQVTFLRKVMGMEGLMNDKRGLTTPSEMT